MIHRFRGQHGFLSNFWPARVAWQGKVWPTVEHAYQASKFGDPAIREAIRAAMSPGGAKAVAHRYAHRATAFDSPANLAAEPDRRLKVMEDLLRQKFADPWLASQLLSTWPNELVEGNTWGDVFWGVDQRSGRGENHLGKLLMKIRDELRAAVAKGTV